MLNKAEFEQISAHLGPSYQTLTPEVINQRIRQTTQYASVLFYIDVHNHQRTVFYSGNLLGRPIPDVPHKHLYTAESWNRAAARSRSSSCRPSTSP